MEETISLKEIFGVIKKRLLMIIAFTAGVALIAAIISFFVLTPKYESSSQFIVNQSAKDKDMQYDVNNLRSNVEIINTYNVIIKSPRILDEVVKELKLPYTSGALKDKLQVSSEQDSQVVTVTVTDASQALATKIANTTVKTFEKNIPKIMNVDNVNILSAAVNPEHSSAVSPKPMLNIAIGLVLGAMIGVGLALLLEYLDNTIRTEETIEKELQLPILGVISHTEADDLRLKQTMKSNASQMKRGGLVGAQKK